MPRNKSNNIAQHFQSLTIENICSFSDKKLLNNPCAIYKIAVDLHISSLIIYKHSWDIWILHSVTNIAAYTDYTIMFRKRQSMIFPDINPDKNFLPDHSNRGSGQSSFREARLIIRWSRTYYSENQDLLFGKAGLIIQRNRTYYSGKQDILFRKPGHIIQGNRTYYSENQDLLFWAAWVSEKQDLLIGEAGLIIQRNRTYYSENQDFLFRAAWLIFQKSKCNTSTILQHPVLSLFCVWDFFMTVHFSKFFLHLDILWDISAFYWHQNHANPTSETVVICVLTLWFNLEMILNQTGRYKPGVIFRRDILFAETANNNSRLKSGTY